MEHTIIPIPKQQKNRINVSDKNGSVLRMKEGTRARVVRRTC